MSDQQLLMPPAQICQALAVGAGGPGQLLLTAVMSCPNVLQSGLQECPKGCGCGLRACAICVSLEEAGPGPGRAALGRIQPLPLNSLPRAGPRIVCWAGLKSSTRSRVSRRWLVVVRPGSGYPGPRGLPPSTGPPLNAHSHGSGAVLQSNGIRLIQLLELQLQPGVLCLSLVELAPTGRQHLGVEEALSVCPKAGLCGARLQSR